MKEERRTDRQWKSFNRDRKHITQRTRPTEKGCNKRTLVNWKLSEEEKMAGDNREVGAETLNAEAQAGIEREVGVWRWESGE